MVCLFFVLSEREEAGGTLFHFLSKTSTGKNKNGEISFQKKVWDMGDMVILGGTGWLFAGHFFDDAKQGAVVFFELFEGGCHFCHIFLEVINLILKGGDTFFEHKGTVLICTASEFYPVSTGIVNFCGTVVVVLSGNIVYFLERGFLHSEGD
ncbi:MAG TPA: hypothetical protein O0X70_07745 [Methanocorpusculum sp.]|nr:hypothetical protein [Methanocorpusculum sp.]